MPMVSTAPPKPVRADLAHAELHTSRRLSPSVWRRVPCAPNRAATRVATLAASAVTSRHLADLKYGRGELIRPLATLTEPSATTVRDREAPGSNPGPPTKIRIRSRRHGPCSYGDGSQLDHNFQRRCAYLVTPLVRPA